MSLHYIEDTSVNDRGWVTLRCTCGWHDRSLGISTLLASFNLHADQCARLERVRRNEHLID